jgi:two-component system, cell cycle sensor histidine kinase and response regulator CckA
MESSRRKVLVVEDDQETLNVFSRTLAGEGYDVIWARNGDDTLKLLTREEAQLALMIVDVVLPGMSGPELVDEVRRTQPSVGAIYISAYDLVEVRAHGVDPDTMAFLPKPFEPDELVRLVHASLQSHHA